MALIDMFETGVVSGRSRWPSSAVTDSLSASTEVTCVEKWNRLS